MIYAKIIKDSKHIVRGNNTHNSVWRSLPSTSRRSSMSKFFRKSAIALALASLLCVVAQAQTVKDYPLHTIRGSDTLITQNAPYGYFGRAEYLLVGGTSGSLYWSMMKWDMSTLPILGANDQAQLMIYGLNINGYQPTDMQLGMSATPWSDTDGWKAFSWYGAVLKTIPATPYNNWMTLDITNWYNYWKSGQIVNNGILFLPLTSSNKYTAPASVEVSNISIRPFVRVTKVATQQGLLLGWPLSTSYSTRVITQAFGVDWAGGSVCSLDQKIKKHSGTDYRAAAHTKVYSTYAGTVKSIVDGGSQWAKAIVIEHTKPDNTRFTSAYWHVNPYVAVGVWINKGDLIADTADLGNNSHFHFGLGSGSFYVNANGKNVSGVGALPQSDCDSWPAFPSVFVDPEKTTQFRFQ